MLLGNDLRKVDIASLFWTCEVRGGLCSVKPTQSL